MLLHYLGKLKNQKFCIFRARKTCFKCYFLPSVQQISCQMSWKYVQRLTLCKYQHFTFCSFTFLSKLKALQLSKVGLLTIKYQHSKNLTPLADAVPLEPKTHENANCLHEFVLCSQKLYKMFTICMDTYLEYFLHWSSAVLVMYKGICLCKWF